MIIKPSRTFRCGRKTTRRAWSRRDFLATGGMAAVALTQADAWAQSGETTGFLSPFFTFDREIQQFMSPRHVPGRALAVVEDRRPGYQTGYGLGGREIKRPA